MDKKQFFNLHFGADNSNRIVVGDRIIEQDFNTSLIFIFNNKKYLKFWGALFFFFGAMISYILLKGVSQWSFVGVLVVFAPFILFGSMGTIYLLRSRRQREWIIDLKQKKIIIGSQKPLPFKLIKEFHITKVEGASDDWESSDSFQLHIRFPNNKSMLWFNADSLDEIQHAGLFLSQKMNIHLNQTITIG